MQSDVVDVAVHDRWSSSRRQWVIRGGDTPTVTARVAGEAHLERIARRPGVIGRTSFGLRFLEVEPGVGKDVPRGRELVGPLMSGKCS